MEKQMLSPKEIAETMIGVGTKKAKGKTSHLLLLGVMAGMFIAFGAVGAIVMGAKVQDPGLSKLLGAAVFPVGLMLVIMAGAELFTGNNLMTIGLLKKEYDMKALLRNWGLVYVGNFVGSIVVAVLIKSTGLFTGPVGDKAMAIASAKVNIIAQYGFTGVLSRAILCNIIVVLAVWLAIGAKDTTGRIFACWFPIMLFVLSGYEHSIANMFFIPVGMFAGANITWSQIWLNNLIPVTIGNVIGGAVIVPVIYYWIYLKEDSKEKEHQMRTSLKPLKKS